MSLQCALCEDISPDNLVACDMCKCVLHESCAGLSKEEVTYLKKVNRKLNFFCNECNPVKHLENAQTKMKTSGVSTQQTSAETLNRPFSTKISLVHNMAESELQIYITKKLDEFLCNSCTIDEFCQDIQFTVPQLYLSSVVTDGYFHVFERPNARIKTGILFSNLIKTEVLHISDFCTGFNEMLNQVNDLTFDIPSTWTSLGEMLLYPICEETLSLTTLEILLQRIIKRGDGEKFLETLFKLMISKKGKHFLVNLWTQSGLSLERFIKPQEVDSFVVKNKLHFLFAGNIATEDSKLTFEQISERLDEFVAKEIACDDVDRWITNNVPELILDNKFIRVLVTVIFEKSISRQKLVKDTLQNNYKLFQKYVTDNPNNELQCLYALQALIHKMGNPTGLYLSICNQLYKDCIISKDSFITWQASDDLAEQEGKGVALTQLAQFFTLLGETEPDLKSSSD